MHFGVDLRILDGILLALFACDSLQSTQEACFGRVSRQEDFHNRFKYGTEDSPEYPDAKSCSGLTPSPDPPRAVGIASFSSSGVAVLLSP